MSAKVFAMFACCIAGYGTLDHFLGPSLPGKRADRLTPGIGVIDLSLPHRVQYEFKVRADQSTASSIVETDAPFFDNFTPIPPAVKKPPSTGPVIALGSGGKPK